MKKEVNDSVKECLAIGINLKNIRLASGLSQEGFAERVGVSRQTVVNWEKGKYLPSADKITVIIKEFSVSFEDIFSGALSSFGRDAYAKENAEENAAEEIAACEEVACGIAEKKKHNNIFLAVGSFAVFALCLIVTAVTAVVNKIIAYSQGDSYVSTSVISFDEPTKLIIITLVCVALAVFAIYGIIKCIKLRRVEK